MVVEIHRKVGQVSALRIRHQRDMHIEDIPMDIYGVKIKDVISAIGLEPGFVLGANGSNDNGKNQEREHVA